MFNLQDVIGKVLIIFTLSSLILSTSQSFSQAVKFQRVVVDKESKKPVPFVSVGVKNKAIGTVADSLGEFELLQNYPEVSDLDSVSFSSIGYETFKTTWGLLKHNTANVFLTPISNQLAAVKISAPKAPVKTFGRGPATIILTPRGYKSIPKTSDEKGREQASIIRIDNDILLHTLKVQVMNREEKNISFRMNIYSVENGIPNKSLLTENVIFKVNGPRRGGVPNVQSVDLRPYRIRIKGFKEIALGIEIIDRELETGDTSNTAFYVPSYPSPLRSSFYRLKSSSAWEKVSNSYLIASIEAAVLKKGDIKEESDDNDAALKSLSKILGKKMLYGYNSTVGRRIKLKDADLYYEIYGKGEPLLLLHGNNEGISSFNEQIGPLSKSFRVIAVDTRGHGNSTNSFDGKYTYELFAADMKQLLDSLHLTKVNVLGWSDGGNTGLEMAIHYPKAVGKLAIMGSNAFSGDKAIEAEVLKTFEERMGLNGKKTDRESIHQKRLAELVLTEPNITSKQLATIRVPVLILAGENDVIKRDHTLFLHEKIKDSRMEIIKGADHYAPQKQPKDFNNLVMDFFLGK
ncbi:alpha/beta fold hydrolase [Desertivirga arenae]|uniref:alpha/beta fold hydrolase n=1 Tax=Desertivirga arenae TaxID=2810309 RepID=UPI001A956A92|nr:alpha/beta fold hydrolase [Pedobacter sp. SYSU D00823]